jgi:hypothetical protein
MLNKLKIYTIIYYDFVFHSYYLSYLGKLYTTLYRIKKKKKLIIG